MRHAPLLRCAAILSLSGFVSLLVRPAPAASEYRCDEGGKPNKTTKKCDCPPGKIESTDAKDVSRCLPAPKPSSSPAPPQPKPPTPTTTPAPDPPPKTVVKTAGPPPVLPPLANPGGKCPAGMAFISGGTFTLAEAKTLAVVADFCLDGMEVTNATYEKCVTAGKCKPPTPWSGSNYTCNWGRAAWVHHPVNCIDWLASSAYCASLGKRLPTEAEWEWAARSGTNGWKFPWGADAPGGKRACWNGEGNGEGTGWRMTTCRAATYPGGANVQGVVDLAGNVAEWTASPPDATSLERVFKGGDFWEKNEEKLAAAARGSMKPTSFSINVGFRCASTP